MALDGAREGLRHARSDLEASHATLQASEERNRLALQAAGMGTWDWDVVSDVHTWSVETEALFGLAPGTFDGTLAAFQQRRPSRRLAGVRDGDCRRRSAERRDSIVDLSHGLAGRQRALDRRQEAARRTPPTARCCA